MRKLVYLCHFLDGTLVVGHLLHGDLKLRHLASDPANGLHELTEVKICIKV